MKIINKATFQENPERYTLVSGETQGAPNCPYGNKYEWIGYDKAENSYVRFTKSVFKFLITQ